MSDESAAWADVAAAAQVPVGEVFGVEVESARILLANVDGTLYALEDECSHAEFPLSEGTLEGTTIECIFHGAKFDVCTGRALQLPAIRPVKSYDVEVRDDRVFVRLN